MVRIGAQQAKSEDDISGYQKPKPGHYHVAVKHVDESFEKFDKVVVDFEILAGTVPGMEGREVTEFFACSEKALPRLQRLALCVGLLKPGEEDKDVEFADATGQQLVIEVEENKYTDKQGKEVNGVRVGYLGMWSLGNKEVADVPKASGAAAIPSEPTQPAKTASGGGGWDDI